MTEAEIAALDQRIEEAERKRGNLVKRLALVDDEEAARLVADQINALSEEARKLGKERDLLGTRRDAFWNGQIRLADIEVFCAEVRREVRVTVPIRDMPQTWPDFAEKCRVLQRLGVEVKLWRADHEPRWVATLRLGDKTKNLCSIGPATNWQATTTIGKPSAWKRWTPRPAAWRQSGPRAATTSSGSRRG